MKPEVQADSPLTPARSPEGRVGETTKRRNLLRRLAAYALLAIVLYLGMVGCVQRSILFPYRMIPAALHAKPGPGVEVIHLTPDDLAGDIPGKVEAWFIPGNGVSASAPGPLVLYAHGNGELIDLWQHELTRYARMGVSVMLLEYRGYGRSAGKPTQKNITRDFVAFHDLAAARPDVDKSRIVFHGRSLGGGAMAALAKERTPRALILESSFTSVTAMAWQFFVPGFLVLDKFDTKRTLRDLDVPVLILHGQRDEVIPVAHAHENAKAARNAKLVIYDMTHNEPAPEAEYWRDIEAFLRDHRILP